LHARMKRAERPSDALTARYGVFMHTSILSAAEGLIARRTVHAHGVTASDEHGTYVARVQGIPALAWHPAYGWAGVPALVDGSPLLTLAVRRAQVAGHRVQGVRVIGEPSEPNTSETAPAQEGESG
jgi:hypothetical protein